MTVDSKPDALQDTYWIENLCEGTSVFRGTGGKFRLEGNGYVGSLVEVERRVAFDPFVRRAIERGKLRQLSEEQAVGRMQDLVIKDAQDSETDHLMDSLSAGASERMSRFVRDDLPDDAESRPSIRAEQVFNREGKPAKTERAVVKRQGSELSEPILDPSAVLTGRVREGEWDTQTG